MSRPLPGRPVVDEALVERFAAYPRFDCGGWGSLHIALADGNLSDVHLQACREDAQRDGDAAGVELAELMLQLSRTQREKLYGKLWARYRAMMARFS